MQNKEITFKKWTIIFGIQLMRKTVLLCKEIVNSVQLSREGEVNSGDIYRDAKRRGIYLALFTDPEGDNCFKYLPNQLNKNKKSNLL